jgi:hypothetical protein
VTANGHGDRRPAAGPQGGDDLGRDFDAGRGLAVELYGCAKLHVDEYGSPGQHVTAAASIAASWRIPVIIYGGGI